MQAVRAMLLPNGGGALIARPGRTGHRPVDGRGLENDLAPVRGMYTCYSAGGFCSLRTHGIVTCGPTGGIALASGESMVTEGLVTRLVGESAPLTWSSEVGMCQNRLGSFTAC